MNTKKVVSLVATSALALGTLIALPSTAFAADSGSNVDMYRLYNRISHEHLYTKDAHEVNVLTRGDWNYEGTGWVAPGKSNKPVYRLYNPVLGDHHYTLDTNEVKVLVSQHKWQDEGIAWYSSEDAKTRKPVYRQFNPALTVGSHNYTTDKNEYDINNKKNGWQAEGVAWYAVGLGNPKATKPADPNPKPTKTPTSTPTSNSTTLKKLDPNVIEGIYTALNKYKNEEGWCLPEETNYVAVTDTPGREGLNWDISYSGFTKKVKVQPKPDYDITIPAGVKTSWTCTYRPEKVYKFDANPSFTSQGYVQVGVRFRNMGEWSDGWYALMEIRDARKAKGLSTNFWSEEFDGHVNTNSVYYANASLATHRAVDYAVNGNLTSTPITMYSKNGSRPLGEAAYSFHAIKDLCSDYGKRDYTNKYYKQCTYHFDFIHDHQAYSHAIEYWLTHPESDGYKVIMDPRANAFTMGLIYLPDTSTDSLNWYYGHDKGGVYVATIVSSSDLHRTPFENKKEQFNFGQLLNAFEDAGYVPRDKNVVSYAWVNPNKTKLSTTTLMNQPAYKSSTTGLVGFKAQGPIWNKAQGPTGIYIE